MYRLYIILITSEAWGSRGSVSVFEVGIVFFGIPVGIFSNRFGICVTAGGRKSFKKGLAV